ncbi:MAG: hypothetical protein IPO97_07960 [Sphingomonadales bacterium]|nr:hypothetical protein [Sphingomonadales bacterium]
MIGALPDRPKILTFNMPDWRRNRCPLSEAFALPQSGGNVVESGLSPFARKICNAVIAAVMPPRSRWHRIGQGRASPNLPAGHSPRNRDAAVIVIWWEVT